MKYFVCIFKKDVNSEVYLKFKKLIDSHYGKVVKHDSDNQYELLYVKDHMNKKFILESFNNLIMDNFIKSYVYVSNNYSNYEEFRDEIKLVQKLFLGIDNKAKQYVFTYKELINAALIFNNTITIKKLILKDIYNNVDYYSMLNVFFLNDLNVLKTAKELSMHRNTLIYRLDKIARVTKLDPRRFNDAHLIKILIDY